MDIEDALKVAGNWGRFQILLYVLITFSGIPNALIAIQYVFAHYEPSHHCKFPDDILNMSYTVNGTADSEAFLKFALPQETDLFWGKTRSSCRMFDRNYSAQDVENWPKYFNTSDKQIACNNGLVFNLEKNQESAVTEFYMACEDDWKPPLVVSVRMAGVAVGSISGALADRFGRRPMFLAACCVQVGCVVLSATAWNFTFYIIASFLGGASGLVNYVVAFVVATEMTDAKWRNFMAIGSLYSYALGYCLVPLLAYHFQNWRTLLWVITALSTAIYLPNVWIFPESARWLVEQRRTDDALKLLKRIARINGNSDRFKAVLEGKDQIIVAKNVPQAGVGESFRVLFRSGLAMRFIAAVSTWFVGGMVYYGVAYYSTTFSEDRFLNVFFAAIAEFPALLISFYFVKFVGRPRSMFFFMMICALSNIVLPFIPEDLTVLKTVLSMLGKGAVSGAFYVCYLIGSEVAPTLQRSASMSMCSFFARIGAVIAPFLMHTGKIHPFLPNGIMGAIGIICATMVIFYIPETNGVTMPDTLEEARSNRRIYGLNIFRSFPPEDRKVHRRENETLPEEHTLI